MIRVWSTMGPREPVQVVQEDYRLWEEWVRQRNAQATEVMPGSFDKAFQCDANYRFRYMNDIRTLQTGFQAALLLSLGTGCMTSPRRLAPPLPLPSLPLARQVDNQPSRERRFPSSKGAHVRTPTSTNRPTREG